MADKTTCKNCQQTFNGYFCNHCGEKVIQKEDLGLKKINSELFNALTFADSKLWRTLKLIITQPGQYSKYYVEGIRVRYMRPISLFFLANLLYFIYPVINTFNTNLNVQLTNYKRVHSNYATALVETRLMKEDLSLEEYSASLEEFSVRYNAKTTELSKLLLILLAILIAPFLWMIHYRKETRIAPHFIIALETMVFLILVCIQLFGLLSATLSRIISYAANEDAIISSAILALLLLFFWKMERAYFKNSIWKSVLNAFLISISITICLFIYRVLLFFVTFYSI